MNRVSTSRAGRSSAWLALLFLLAFNADAQTVASTSSGTVGGVPIFETGYTSAYTARFHGRRTASGETYNHYGLSAAHRTLPMGTYVKVVSVETGRSVVVRINDRGPYVRDRILDLSGEAAQRLGLAEGQLLRAHLLLTDAGAMAAQEQNRATEAAPAATPPPSTNMPAAPATPAATTTATEFVVQLGSFQDQQAALHMVKVIQGTWVQPVDTQGQRLYRVNYGLFDDEAAARFAAQKMAKRGHEGFIRRLQEGAPALAIASTTPPAPPVQPEAVEVVYTPPTTQPEVVPPAEEPAAPAPLKTWGKQGVRQ